MSPASDGCFQRAWEAGSGGLSAGLLVAGAVAQSLGGQRWLAELDNRRYRSRGKKLRHSLRNVPRPPIPSSRWAWGARRAGTPVVTVAKLSRFARQPQPEATLSVSADRDGRKSSRAVSPRPTPIPRRVRYGACLAGEL